MPPTFPSASDTMASCAGNTGGCTRPPGKGESGCAFRGAKRALQPIADAAHLVHGLASCEVGSWVARPTLSSGPGLYRASLSTAMTGMDTALGGEAKLARAIDQVVAAHDPPALFVYQTCVPALIGDDIDRVCRAAASRWNRPVVAVDAAGFRGSLRYGVHVAAQALLDHVVGTAEPETVGDTDVVVIGEYNLAGELDRIRPLFDAVGIRLVASLSGDGRVADIARAHRARAALLVCSQGMAGLAAGLRDRWGVPVLKASFHGHRQTADSLRRLARILIQRGGPADLDQRVEHLVAVTTARQAAPLAVLRDRLRGRRVMVLTNGAKVWSLAALLRELGMVVVATQAGAACADELDMVRRRAGPEVEVWRDWTLAEVDRRLRDGAVDLVVGGGMAKFVALKAGIPFLDSNHDRGIALTGFDGTLALAREIDLTLSNPVWRQVRQLAPWAGQWGQVVEFPSCSAGVFL